MKRMVFLATSMIALWAACITASGQELKSLKSFDGNEIEYLKYNFEEENYSFKGRSFGELMSAVEAKLQTVEIYYKIEQGYIFMDLYLQDPGYVKNDALLREIHLIGISISFEEDSALKEATKKVFEAFPVNNGPATVHLTKENMGKLIELLRRVKISRVFYEDKKSWIEWCD